MAIKVIIPHAKYGLQHLVAVALQYDCVEPVFHHCVENDSYYRLLLNLWHEGETFILVEHDIIPWPGAITELANCSGSWCVFPYNVHTDGSLGCTKFHGELLRKHPDALDEPFYRDFDKHWACLDGYVGDKMIEFGIKAHVHKPNVAHLHAHECMRKGLLNGYPSV